MRYWNSYWDRDDWIRRDEADEIVFNNCSIEDLVTVLIKETNKIQLEPNRYTRIQINDILTLVTLRDHLNKMITEKWLTKIKLLKILGE